TGQGSQPSSSGLISLQNNIIDPTTSQIVSAGNRMASVATAITFDAGGAGSTSITFYWDGTHGSTPFMIGRDDNTRVGPITNGSPFTVSGLTAATTYFFYPYYDEISQSIRFSGARPPQGIIGTVPVGNPPVAYTAQTFWPAQDQMLRGRIQLA